MKRYYYITIAAVAAICLLQTFYVRSLHNGYVAEVINNITGSIQISIEKERHIRSVYTNGQKPKEHQYVYVKLEKDMTPEEKASLPEKNPEQFMYDMDEAREKGIATTTMEFVSQILQDNLLEKGFSLDLNKLDSIFLAAYQSDLPHAFHLYDKEKKRYASIGEMEGVPDYTTRLIPIGTKGLQYLQLEADIPWQPFFKNQVWALVLSVVLMIFVVLCMTYHLVVIRRKDELLQRREETINGTIHDLKSPLNSALVTLGWLASGENGAAKQQAIEICRAEMKHQVCNIESLLVTVRKDRKRLVLKKEEVDMAHVAVLVKNSLDALYRTKPHTIEIEDRLPKDVKVQADGMYIENVLRNLVENALKYSDDGVRVKVVLTTVGGDTLRVEVQDNGWGIAPRYQKKLFKQFYQVPREKERIRKGYGIGLAQSKYIIDEHRGRLTVQSEEGAGSVFAFTIPLK